MQFLAFGGDELRADGADHNGEDDERKDVAEGGAVVADESAEEIFREKHFDQRGETKALAGLMGGDGALGGAAELRHETRLGLGREIAARLQHVHQQQAEGDADGHVEKKEGERAGGEGTELVEPAELHDAGGEGGEDQGNDDKEKQTEENLADGIEVGGRDVAHERQKLGRETADDERGRAGDDADAETDQDTIRKGAVGFGHGKVMSGTGGSCPTGSGTPDDFAGVRRAGRVNGGEYEFPLDTAPT